MEPMSESQKRDILERNSLATPEMIEEYQKLLAEKFANPPSHAVSPNARDGIRRRNERIKELRRMLFPDKIDG
jgi:hypothetical protein